MNQDLLLADILKFTKKVLWENFTFCAYCDKCLGKKVMLAAYFKLLM